MSQSVLDNKSRDRDWGWRLNLEHGEAESLDLNGEDLSREKLVVARWTNTSSEIK